MFGTNKPETKDKMEALNMSKEDFLDFFTKVLFGIFYFDENGEGKAQWDIKITRKEKKLFAYFWDNFLSSEASPYDEMERRVWFYVAMLDLDIVSVLVKVPYTKSITKERKLDVYIEFLQCLLSTQKYKQDVFNRTHQIQELLDDILAILLFSLAFEPLWKGLASQERIQHIANIFILYLNNNIPLTGTQLFILTEIMEGWDVVSFLTESQYKELCQGIYKQLTRYKDVFHTKRNGWMTINETLMGKTSFNAYHINEIDNKLQKLEEILEIGRNGRKNSLWQWFLTEKKNILNTLRENIVGQNHVIDKMMPLIGKLCLGINKRPVSTLFCWKSWVGKTQLATEIASLMDSEICLINMGNMEHSMSMNMLLGSPPWYINSWSPTIIENYLERLKSKQNNVFPIIVFDEIEKAAPEVYNIWLELLDRGTLTLLNWTVIDLNDALIIMTSNLWVEENKPKIGFQSPTEEEQKEEEEHNYNKAIENHISPEILNRIEEIIIFNSLSETDYYKIKALAIKKMVEKTLENNSFFKKVVWEKTINDIVNIVSTELSSLTTTNIRKIERAVEDSILKLIFQSYE